MSSVSSESCEEEDGDFMFEESPGADIHPLLLHDIELLQVYLNGETIKQRIIYHLNEIDVFIPISTTFLEANSARAWGLIPNEPIIFKLTLDASNYVDSLERKHTVDAYQDDMSTRSNVINQLRTVCTDFILNQAKTVKTEILSQSYLDLWKSNAELQTAEEANRPSPSKTVGAPVRNLHDAKCVPRLDHGFLVQIHKYMTNRLLTISDYCPVCDDPHLLSMNSLMKPTVCSKPLCTFSSQTLGVMADIVSALTHELDVVELLVSLTKVAVCAVRCDEILTPYPSIFNPSSNQEFILHANAKDKPLLRHLIGQLPSIYSLTTSSETKLREQLNAKDVSCYPLLRWILSSNRCHIAKLPDTKQFDFIRTTGQFLLLNSPPAKEARFRALRKKHGSMFAFHGSPLENWHSIVRQGLAVYSGTSKQLHGASYGSGIYLSTDLDTALFYSSSQRQKPEAKLDRQLHINDKRIMYCTALCEVITSPALTNPKKRIWVCPDSGLVCTRFFFAFYTGHKFGNNSPATKFSPEELAKRVNEVLS